tara:strand:- start:810 stop:1415 length:606 start_codon:yes stop_codon:yes gene_type:complete
MFISFEGIEGSGKSTQIKIISESLQKKGHDVISVREPGGTEVGEKIRKIFLQETTENFDPLTEVLLLYASRKQLDNEIIKPNLKKGSIVIADRFFHATKAYQCYGKGVELNLVEYLHKTLNISEPDLSIYIDINPELSRKRISNRKADRIEQESLDFFSRVQHGYLQLEKESKNFILVDGSKSIEKISGEIDSLIKELLNV